MKSALTNAPHVPFDAQPRADREVAAANAVAMLSRAFVTVTLAANELGHNVVYDGAQVVSNIPIDFVLDTPSPCRITADALLDELFGRRPRISVIASNPVLDLAVGVTIAERAIRQMTLASIDASSLDPSLLAKDVLSLDPGLRIRHRGSEEAVPQIESLDGSEGLEARAHFASEAEAIARVVKGAVSSHAPFFSIDCWEELVWCWARMLCYGDAWRLDRQALEPSRYSYLRMQGAVAKVVRGTKRNLEPDSEDLDYIGIAGRAMREHWGDRPDL